MIATGSDDRTIRIWDAATGVTMRVISALPRDVFGLAFDPSGRVIYCVGRGPELLVLDTATGAELASLIRHEKSVFRVVPLPGGRGLMTGGEDPWISVWDFDRLRSYVRGNAPMWQATPDGVGVSGHRAR